MYSNIYALNRLICCCFSSCCGVSTYNFIRCPSSQASADPTSDVYIVAFSFSICLQFVLKLFCIDNFPLRICLIVMNRIACFTQPPPPPPLIHPTYALWIHEWVFLNQYGIISNFQVALLDLTVVFIAGTLQNFSRKYRIPIDLLGFEFEVTDADSEMEQKPVILALKLISRIDFFQP